MRIVAGFLFLFWMGAAGVSPLDAVEFDQAIEGRLSGPTGNAAVGSCIKVTRVHAPGMDEILGSFRMNQDGTYRIPLGFAGDYALDFGRCMWIDEAAYPYVGETYNNANPDAPTLVSVPAGGTVSGIDATLSFKAGHGPELGTVTVKVVDEEGLPVPGISVEPWDGEWYRGWLTGGDGRVWFEAEPGTRRYFAHGDSHMPVWYSAVEPYAIEYEDASAVAISPGVTSIVLGPITSPAGESFVQDGYARDFGTGYGATWFDPVNVEMTFPDYRHSSRIGIRTLGESAELSSYEIWAYSTPGLASVFSIDFWFHDDLLSPDEQALQIPVFVDGLELLTCAMAPPGDACVLKIERAGDSVQIQVSETLGGIFAFGDQPTFADTRTSIFLADIEWLADSGITKGCNPPLNTQFCPEGNVTRGQMAAFLVRALNLTDEGSVDFIDDETSVFEADIERLAAAGITRGCNPPVNDRFCPGSPVTRGQMAAFLHRAIADE